MNSVITGHEHHSFLLLVAGNIGLEAIHKWVVALQPVFSLLVSVGQAAVAIATVIYIVRKTHLLGKHKKTK
jgi:hypothetical protein